MTKRKSKKKTQLRHCKHCGEAYPYVKYAKNGIKRCPYCGAFVK